MLDSYTLKARASPVLLGAAPALILIGVSALDLSVAGSVAGLVVASVGVVACGAVRGRGLQIQPGLWASWGGPPTTQRLRWEGNSSKAIAIRHRQIETITGERLPTRSEEKSEPVGADQRYAAAVSILREKTRGADFAPLASENAEYGFRRNCLGIRPVAITAGVAVAVICAVLLIADYSSRHLICGLIAGFATAFWWGLVTPSWVRRAAELYADRLFEAAAGLAAPAKPS